MKYYMFPWQSLSQVKEKFGEKNWQKKKCKEALRMSCFSPDAQLKVHDSFLWVLHKDFYPIICSPPQKKINLILLLLKCFKWGLIDCTIYSILALPWLNYVPVHVFPLPVYPGLQAQMYEAIVLLHCAFTWQGEGNAVHSSISAANINIFSIKSSMKKLDVFVTCH